MSIELLAPAGSYESMVQAFDAGADAVYLGGGMFGARAYAPNFTEEELLTAIDEAHGRGRKLYLTVNTLLKNKELYGQLYRYLGPYYEQGLDGVILQDMGVLQFVLEEFPGLPVHASTQMTVTGPKGAAFLESLGVERVVTARELSLEELQAIRSSCNLEIESFVHGALCYCYSGQCLFSSLLGGRSGNRGRCAQPCRLPYEVWEGAGRLTGRKEVCPLSPKDMCTIDLLPEIIAAGVTSLKIEGRMKQPSYTAGVVNIYRKYLDLYLDGQTPYEVEEADHRELLALFHRGGFNRGYYEMRNGKEMMAFSNEKKTGVSTREIIKVKEKIKGNLILSSGKSAILELDYKGHDIFVTGEQVQKAMKQPVSRERVRQQMMKTGNTPFIFEDLKVVMEEDLFIPMSGVNQLRRDGVEKLLESLRLSFRRKLLGTAAVSYSGRTAHKTVQRPSFRASCATLSQAEVLLSMEEVTGLYCSYEVARQILGKLGKRELYLALPMVTRQEDFPKLEQWVSWGESQKISGYLAANLESWAYLKERGLEERTILDSTLYTYNNESVDFWLKQKVRGLTAPLELNAKELFHRNNARSELLVYGYLPMMISAQCLKKNHDCCDKKEQTLTLRDRYAKEFPVKCCCEFCYNIIYNSIPFGLLQESSTVKSLGFSHLRMAFTIESKEETRRIAGDFLQFYGQQNPVGVPDYDFTKGHFKRGVE